MDKRFLRTEALLGKDALQKLSKTTVMIVGLGAVGGYALEALVRAGIGRFILVDFDVFEITNINRQLLATEQTLGQKKVEAALDRVLSINPKAKVITKDMFVNAETVEELLSLKPDFVVDAIDSLNPKCCLMETLQAKEIPFISSMGAALKTNPELIKIAPLHKSKNCALAKFIRKRLSRRGVDLKKITCVFSEELVDLPQTAMFMEEGKNRHTLGSLPTITAIFGLFAANYVINSIVKNLKSKI